MADDDDKSGTKTFTQAEVDRIVRDRIAREREKYADYDDLKKAAGAADASKSQLDKMQDQLNKITERAEKAERENLRREVADELGLTPKEMRRLRGDSREALLADGREMIEDLGIDIEARKKGGTTDRKANDDDRNDDGEGKEGESDRGDNRNGDAGSSDDRRDRGRPREALRSGSPGTRSTSVDETDPMKLAALIPRR